MTALASSINLFTNICQLAEDQIEAHFNQVDETTNHNPDNDALRVIGLSHDIANQLQLKDAEVLYAIQLYLRNRPDLELKSNKGICRIGDDRVKSAMTPKECAMKNYNAVKAIAPEVIDHAFSVAEEEARTQGLMVNKVRLNFQDLRDKIAEKLNVKPYSVYHCLKQYIQDERRDLIVALGRQGGLMKR
jgi:hypothetical protein